MRRNSLAAQTNQSFTKSSLLHGWKKFRGYLGGLSVIRLLFFFTLKRLTSDQKHTRGGCLCFTSFKKLRVLFLTTLLLCTTICYSNYFHLSSNYAHHVVIDSFLNANEQRIERSNPRRSDHHVLLITSSGDSTLSNFLFLYNSYLHLKKRPSRRGAHICQKGKVVWLLKFDVDDPACLPTVYVGNPDCLPTLLEAFPPPVGYV